MPAHRSRTERWRDCLRQIYERGGGIEFAISSNKTETPQTEDGARIAPAPDLMWRVRVLGLADAELLVERPGAAGTSVPIEPGLPVICVISVGQNRWMFRSKTLGPANGAGPWGAAPAGIRLEMPQTVERCHRRDFLRVSTAELHLPHVECWPLLDPTTVGPAETANRATILDLLERPLPPGLEVSPPPSLLPEVGPSFSGSLMNIGAGGVGLIFSKEHASAADKARYVWIRLHLMPHIPAPIAVTAKLVHKHLDSEQNLVAGAAFEFGFNASHKPFVVEQIGRFVNLAVTRARIAA
jgi:hypothetical protein